MKSRMLILLRPFGGHSRLPLNVYDRRKSKAFSSCRRWWFLSCHSGGLGSWESDDDADMDDEDSVVTALGCLGPLGGLLAPELQRYQRHLKGRRSHMNYYREIFNGGQWTAAKKKILVFCPRFDSNYKPSLICFLQTNPPLPPPSAALPKMKSSQTAWEI